jgi:hypothetical protein
MFKKAKQFKDAKEAEKWYKEQEAALRRVAQHPDFYVLQEYWEREYDSADRDIDMLVGKGNELDRAVIARSIVRKHQQFIQNLTE